MLADDSSREPVSHYQHGIQAGNHESSVRIELETRSAVLALIGVLQG
jgi:hypothetical protein